MIEPKSKLDILKESLESGIIDSEEYDKWKDKLEPDINKNDKKLEEINVEQSVQEEPKKSSEKVLIISIAVIVLLFLAILFITIFNKPEPKPLEELHILNLKGKLKPSQGYVYKEVYSFVTMDNLWYTQLKSPKGSKLYSLALRYSPRELKDVPIEGNLNSEFFNNQSEFFVTFNPSEKDFSYLGLAVADFNTHMAQVFEKKPIAACDRNETEACKSRPIVTCEDKDKLVFYIKESDKFRAYYNDNCIVVEGNGFDLVKGVDRILYNLYNIMAQEEA
ncbi:MAG: SHOCT domain-containing protein [Nanoarchaeota archaeon]